MQLFDPFHVSLRELLHIAYTFFPVAASREQIFQLPCLVPSLVQNYIVLLNVFFQLLQLGQLKLREGGLAPGFEDESADLFVAGDLEIVADGVAVGVEGPEEEGLCGLVQEVRNRILMIIHVKIMVNFISYCFRCTNVT